MREQSTSRRAARRLSLLLLPALAALATAADGTAQSVSERAATAASGLRFRELGPSIVGGRVADIAVVESDTRIFYVGLGAGSVWKTTNDGMTWDRVFDDQPAASIGDVTVAPSNPNVVWVGTGEPQNRQSSTWGNGVYKSTDAGRTWRHMGLDDTHHVGRIAIDHTNPDIVFVGAVGHLWGPNEERGVFRTKDGGETWEKVLYVDENTGVVDIIMDHHDPKTLFAATYQRRRTGFGFAAGGGGSGIWRTTDGGDTWTRLGNGLPTSEMGRIGLDIYRRDGNLVYAIIEAEEGAGVYRSTDRGETWEMMSDRNPRPMYFSLIRIDPNNPERIYIGGVQESASDDGGRTWWPGNSTDQIHSDHHALWIDPNDSNHLIDGNDGGLAFSRDASVTWRAITNMPVAQFYEVDVDFGEPYRICGGLQDNGNWCGPHRTQATWGPRNRDWSHVWFGDGFHNHIDPTDPNIMYSESQGANIGRIDVRTRESQSIRPIPRTTGDDEPRQYRFNWNSPVKISSHDPATVYLGGNHLMRTRDRGTTWEEASPDLTKAIDRDTMPIMGRNVTNETLSGNDGISSYGNITAIGESRQDPNVLYVGTDDGNLQVTRDGGTTWTNVIDRVPGVPPRTYVQRIETSYAADGRVYVAFDGHRNDDYTPYVFVSQDFGQTWRAITNGLPGGWTVNVIREHPANQNLLLLGNEIGLYISVDRGATWARMKNNLPTVAVDDIVIHPRENDLILGTHGRSIWLLDDMTPLQELSADMLAEDAHLFGSRRATIWSMGMDWPFQPAVFVADNPPEGVPLRYYLREPAGEDAISLEILDGNEVIRTLEPSNETGIQEVVWDFRLEPAFEAQGGGGGGFRGGAPAGAGPRVMAGTYTARLTVNGSAQTRDFQVRLDPRRTVSQADLMARQNALMDAYALQKPYRDAQDRLRAMNDRVSQVQSAMKDAAMSDAEKQALDEQIEALSTELGDVGRELQRAMRAGGAGSIDGWAGAPTADQLWGIDQTWAALPGVIQKVNALITERMPAFEQRVSAAGLRPAVGDPIPVPRRP